MLHDGWVHNICQPLLLHLPGYQRRLLASEGIPVPHAREEDRDIECDASDWELAKVGVRYGAECMAGAKPLCPATFSLVLLRLGHEQLNVGVVVLVHRWKLAMVWQHMDPQI